MNKIDQLFKTKLDQHLLAPSEDAWAKVEAGLSKKNRAGWFVRTRTKALPWVVSSQTTRWPWRMAAAILLMCAIISILIWSQRDSEKTPALAEKKNVHEKEKVRPSEKANILTKRKEQPTVQQQPIQKQVSDEPNEQSVQPQLEKLEKNNPVEDKTEIAVSDQKIEMKEIKVEEKISTNATPRTEVASTRQKPIKLEFTLEEPSVETVATTSEVKNTGLKKVWEMAREIKQGEGPVFSLREKKDEFFARSFTSAKQKVH